MAAIKRTPADIAFSKCIREAADWQCVTCGKQHVQGSGGLECSHGYSRGNWSIRFKAMNARAQCTACHFRCGPAWMLQELTDFERTVLEEWRVDLPMAKVYRATKGKGEIAKHYREQHTMLLQQRAEGMMGELSFDDWF